MKINHIKTYRNFLLATLLIFSITSCNYFQEKDLPDITALNPPKSHKIKKVAVLFFKNETKCPEIEPLLRKSLSTNLSSIGYTVIRLNEIDYLLEMAEISIDNIESIDPYQLGRILKSDALIYGTITKCSKMFAALYSNVSVGAKIKMVDAITSQMIWEAEHVERTHGGGFPSLSPFGIPIEIAESALNLRDKVIEDTAERLVKKFIAGIPENPYEAKTETIRITINGNGDNKMIKYIVSSGDTLYKIADKFYGTGTKWEDIKQVNKNIHETDLQTDQEIIIPNVPILDRLEDISFFKNCASKNVAYKIKWGDSLYKIASVLYNNGKKWNVIYENNKNAITTTTDLLVGQVLLLPLKDKL